MTQLAIDRLTVRHGSQEVLRDVSFTLSGGDLVGLIGPNGAGKSTLLRAIMGLNPAAGSAAIDGVALSAISAEEKARKLSYLPQEREIAWPISVEDVVMLGRTPYLSPLQRPTAEDQAIVEQAMIDADIVGLRSRIIAELSGGERARVLIARTLAQDTPVLIADEPTAGLDPAHQIDLMRVLSKRAARGSIVLVSLHELSLAAQWCPRLILLSEGALVADGAPDGVLSESRLRAVYGISAHIARTDRGLIVQPIERVDRGAT